jgi:pantoate--beta-alanine ligase
VRLHLGEPPEACRDLFRQRMHRAHVAPLPPEGQVPHMEVVRKLDGLQPACAALRERHGSLALVPTMGALHDGHRALISAAVDSGAGVAASIFVNPLQFGPNEDLSRYPRDEDGDLAALRACGCHLVWMPDVATMYPPGDATTIEVAGPAEQWEGAARPGHFRGVATVCAKLFGQVRPNRAYFGEKDWQQLQVVRRMVADLHLPLDIIGVPTVREPDGLAMSSRNRFLTGEERATAPRLHAALAEAANALRSRRTVNKVLGDAKRDLTQAGFRLDYLALVDGHTMSAIAEMTPGARLIVAAALGSVRLIDNIAAC